MSKVLPESSFFERSVLPSILSADLMALGEDLDAIRALKIDTLHVDIMDGHFVPNLTFGPSLVKALRGLEEFFLDVHLMAQVDLDWLDWFIEAGAHRITFHIEATDHTPLLLSHLKKRGIACGLSLKPGTPPASIKPYLDHIDQVLVMTVEPGFGGQAFREDQLEKIEKIHTWIDQGGFPVRLAVDGGIGPETLALCSQRGADTFIAGQSFFKGGRRAFRENYEALICALKGGQA